jgi:gamma-tubulin complex component 5
VEEEGDADGGEIRMDDGGKEYKAVLRELHEEFERLLVVVASGLRSAARGRAEEKAAKWELLAEMLEVGIKV